MNTVTTPAVTPTESAQVLALCNEASMAGGWVHPFFLIPLSHARWEVTRSVTTMSVTADLKIRVNPDFVRAQDQRQLCGVIFHEVLHPLLGHHHRVASRDPKKWGIACDMVINSMLRALNMPLPQGAFYAPHGMENASAEEVYEKVTDQDVKRMAPQNVGQGCQALAAEPEPGDEEGKGKGEDGEGEEGGKSMGPGDGEEFWGEVLAQAESMARGTAAWEVVAKLFKVPQSTVKWESLVRSTINRVAASGGRDMTTASRRNRRSPPGIVLPGWISHRPQVAVVVDTSGSMSDDMVAQAVAETVRIARAAGAALFMVLHDHRPYWSGWVDYRKADGITKRINNRGGTDCHAAYAVVAESRGRFDAMIHLTDTEVGEWPDLPGNCRRGIIGAIPFRNGHCGTGPEWAQLVQVNLGGA